MSSCSQHRHLPTGERAAFTLYSPALRPSVLNGDLAHNILKVGYTVVALLTLVFPQADLCMQLGTSGWAGVLLAVVQASFAELRRMYAFCTAGSGCAVFTSARQA